MSFLKKYHTFLLTLILGFSFFTRVLWLSSPDQYVFDEVYHAITAKLIARGDVRAFEWWNPPVEAGTVVDWLHPPLAKYFQAFSISTFGENTFGWRFSSAIFGVLVIFLTYKLSYELFKNKNLSLLSAFLASLDGLLLAQSRIAMNDIHVTFFILLTLLFYLRYRSNLSYKHLALTSISGGLAISSKWSGLFVLFIIVCAELFRSLNEKSKIKQKLMLVTQSGFRSLLFFVVIPVLIYICVYTPMFLQGKSLICNQTEPIRGKCYFERIQIAGQTWEGYVSHFVELHRQIYIYQTTLTATHGYQSRPWQWFINSRPVWFYVLYGEDEITNIYSQGNHVLFWTGGLAVIATTGLALFRLIGKKIRHKTKELVKPNLFFLLFAYFFVWLPWQFSPRIMFFYHYTPAVPLMTILLSYWLIKASQVKMKLGTTQIKGNIILFFIIVACVINFVVFYPNWVGIAVPTQFANQIYFALKTWK